DHNFRALFDEIDADHPMAIASVFDLENRQRRGALGSYAIERYFCACRSPFLDYDLSSFLADVPPRLRFQQRLYKKMIVRHFPEAKDVPWAYTHHRISDSSFFEFSREALNFAKARLLPRRLARWSFRDNVALMRADRNLRTTIEAFIASDLFDGEIFDARG